MKLAILLALVTAPALADTLTFEPTPDVPGQVGLLHYENTPTLESSEADMTFETPAGPLVVRIGRTPNAPCEPDCPDTLEVLATPDATIAVPGELVLPEWASAVVVVKMFEGM